MRLLPITAAIAASLVLASCGGDDGESQSDPDSGKSSAAEVEVKTFIFNPDPITVDTGTQVTWTNADQADHDVTSGTRAERDKRFGGKLAESGGTYSTTFDKPGTYKYFCSLHSGAGMTGEVVVR
jgi:plastocyanin